MVSNNPPYKNPYTVKESNRKTVSLPRAASPSVLVIEGKSRPHKSFSGEERPEVPFAAAFFLVNHDPRLTLSSDTYVQLTMAAGLKIKVKQPGLNKLVNKWAKDIELERKIESGLYSYYDVGNMMYEKEPKLADLTEIDMATVTMATRNKNTGEIDKYITEPSSMEKPIPFSPEEVIHFRYTETRKEAWGRGLYHALFAEKDIDGDIMNSPIINQWKMEDDMVKVFDSYASPMMMITFKDSGPEWIKKQETEFKKMKAGAKILTDKEFDAKIFEVNPAAKFDKYVEHLQTNIMETGSQFPLGFFNAEFTTRAAAEITDSVLGRKIKRIQKKIARQIKSDIVMPYLKSIGKIPDEDDVNVSFEIESKSEIGNAEIAVLFEKGVLTRSEFRKHLIKKTTIELDEEDMEDTPPITSVTPTDDLRTTQPSPASQQVTPAQQQSQLAQMQQNMNELKKLVEEKIPKPRGRPKKE